jgi:2-polyprenyl-6-methoxyphenol hydroxylase-like FAD-dependent oxidoreductase
MLNASRFRMRRQVLVVGAGPIGLMAALRLRDMGVDVRVLDPAPAQSEASSVVVLYPHSLRLLQDLGLSTALFWVARGMPQLAVYADGERRATLELPLGWRASPGAATLPQNVLIQALTRELARRGAAVEWGARISKLYQDDRAVWGSVTQQRSQGDPADISPFQADFVIGADGAESTVRRVLGIQLEPLGPRRDYLSCEAQLRRPPSEAQLALGAGSSSVVYPARDDRHRFTFELDQALPAPTNDVLRDLVHARFPWLDEPPASYEHVRVESTQGALASRLGMGRVWLAGDAAHAAGPLADHVLNIGLSEVNELVLRMAEKLKRPTLAAFGDGYQSVRMRQWRELLGGGAAPPSGEREPGWLARHRPRLLEAIPAMEQDLDDLMLQLNQSGSSGRMRVGVTASVSTEY